MTVITSLAVPSVLVFCGFLMVSGRCSFDDFVRGALDGLRTAVMLLPTLAALVCALSMLEKSGAEQLLGKMLSPLLTAVGLPTELVPLALTRPFSGSASTAAFSSLLEKCGADSLPARIAAVMMGSSDTLFYVMGVYFSKTHVKKAGRAMLIGGASSLLCLILSSLLVRVFF